MSLDIFFQPCRFGEAPIEKKNPFTGELQSVFPVKPLSGAELSAVRQVLKQATTKDFDEADCQVVTFQDGGIVEVDAGNLEEGCRVGLSGMTPDVLQFLYDLLSAGRWAMIPAMEDLVAVTTSRENVSGESKNFPRVVECRSAEELGRLLSDGVRAWEEYRDRIVGDE